MHLGTSTAILLAFSLFGDLCGPKKPPEPPPVAPASDGSFKRHFEESHAHHLQTFDKNLASIEVAEAEYQDQIKGLSDNTKKTAMYGAYVTKHDNLVAQTEALKAAREAFNAYFEQHKQEPGNRELNKMGEDARAANHKADRIIGDYRMLDLNLHNLGKNNP